MIHIIKLRHKIKDESIIVLYRKKIILW